MEKINIITAIQERRRATDTPEGASLSRLLATEPSGSFASIHEGVRQRQYTLKRTHTMEMCVFLGRSKANTGPHISDRWVCVCLAVARGGEACGRPPQASCFPLMRCRGNPSGSPISWAPFRFFARCGNVPFPTFVAPRCVRIILIPTPFSFSLEGFPPSRTTFLPLPKNQQRLKR